MNRIQGGQIERKKATLEGLNESLTQQMSATHTIEVKKSKKQFNRKY